MVVGAEVDEAVSPQAAMAGVGGDQLGQLAQVLGGGGEEELVAGAAGTS